MGPVLVDTSANSRRTIAFLIVVVVHVLLIYGFNAGIGSVMVERVFGPMETQIIEEVKEEEEKPPPPPPKLETPPPFVPPPDIAIEVAPVENTTAIQVTTTTRPVEAPPPAPVRKIARSAPAYDKRRSYTLPDYPPSELRAGNEGTVYLDLFVTVDGRIGEVRVKTSSGFPRLDEAAISHVKRTYRLSPAMEDGKPVADWVTLPVVFRIDKK